MSQATTSTRGVVRGAKRGVDRPERTRAGHEVLDDRHPVTARNGWRAPRRSRPARPPGRAPRADDRAAARHRRRARPCRGRPRRRARPPARMAASGFAAGSGVLECVRPSNLSEKRHEGRRASGACSWRASTRASPTSCRRGSSSTRTGSIPTGLRDGTIGLAPLTAVLSFLRREGDAYALVTTRAGEYAAEWTVDGLPAYRRAFIRADAGAAALPPRRSASRAAWSSRAMPAAGRS